MTDVSTAEDGPEEFDRGPGTAIEANVHGSALAATRSFVEEYIKPTFVQVLDPISGVAVPATLSGDGIEAIPASIFDDYLPNPRFRRGTATLLDLDSFISFVNRHKDDDSLIFADNDRIKPTITAILDYNHAGSEALARHGDHRATHAFPLSDEWKAWIGQDATAMSQFEFGKFLEDNIVDVWPDPNTLHLTAAQSEYVNRFGGIGKLADPARLFGLAMNFAVTDVQQAVTATTLQSGEMQVEFKSEHADQTGQKINVPSMFVIGIPVFKGGESYLVLARLRYRVLHGSVTFFFELWRTDIVFDHAFAEATDRVHADTSVPVLLGKPETA